MTSFILHLYGYFGRAVFTFSMLLQKRKGKVCLYWSLIFSACDGDSNIPGYFNPLDILNYPEGYFMQVILFTMTPVLLTASYLFLGSVI